MSVKLKYWVAVAIALAVVTGPARAEFVPKVGVVGSTVTVNGRAAIRFQTANGKLAPGDRATITSQRLAALVAARFDPNTLCVRGGNGQARIYAGESLVFIITSRDARIARASASALAGTWRANVRSLLLMPAVVLSDRDIVVPLGENRRVYVTGAATGPIYAKSAKGEVAPAVPGTDGRYVQITGQQAGQTSVEIGVEGENAVVNVSVMKYAGGVCGESLAEVTGSPCSGRIVSYAATQAVLRRATLELGAGIQVVRVTDDQRPLDPGATRDVKVEVRISGPGYITYSAEPVVQVHNSVMPPDDVRQLFYSNSPERLLKFQTLFAGKLDGDKSTRILYHHQNAMGKRARFIVELVNPTASPAAFRVFKGVSAPLIDTVLVGYNATSTFMKDQRSNSSVIERVPAQSRLMLVSDDLGDRETSSGVLQVRQTDGAGSYIRVAAIPPGVDDAPVGSLTAVPNIVEMELSEHIYPMPAKTLEAGYVVGRQWAFISIGKHAIGSHNSEKKLDGNYGVTYDINVKVENPTDRTKKVSVMFDPSAGLASGVFMIDGQFIATKYAKPPSEIPLVSYSLKPGETRKIRITTLPVAGSNYPATLVVKS